jgi:phosphatidylserine/phosphatidylglycerophosphate/cardiolipin synthase-like enzyme
MRGVIDLRKSILYLGFLNLTIILGVCLGSCMTQPPQWLDPLPTITPAEYSSPDQLYSIYFTAPANEDFKGGPDRFLADAIDQARSQIDAALYDLNLWSIRNALIRAHQRGVLVRLVVENDSLDRTEIQELISAGIPTIPDQGEGLMHNKFVVIDGSEVWTGSMNLTVNGAYRHLNNLVRFRSTLIAENFTSEFDEMFLDGYFGEDILENTPHPDITLNGIRVETFFSPDDETPQRLIELILSAEESIDFLYYSFTSDSIAEAIINQANRGVEVRGVLDSYQERTGLGGEYQRLVSQGLEVYLDTHPEKLHHKVIIIDQNIVITGSYNLTRSASEKNDENTLIIHDRKLAEIFLGEFEWIFEDAVTW